MAERVEPGRRDAGGRVFIFLNGGGACWDAFTCYTLGTAANIESGYGATQFAGDAGSLLSSSFFDRHDATNRHQVAVVPILDRHRRLESGMVHPQGGSAPTDVRRLGGGGWLLAAADRHEADGHRAQNEKRERP